MTATAGSGLPKDDAKQGGHIPAGYRSAMEGAAVVDRSDRRYVVVSGRAPARMLAGLFSGSLPPDLGEPSTSGRRGRMPYSALLTPKGKIVADLRIARLGNGEEGPFLIELPPAGYKAALERMQQYLPPRFARLEEPGEPIGLLTVIGPRAPELIEAAIMELPDPRLSLAELDEGEELVLEGAAAMPTRIVRTGDVTPPAWDVIAPLPVVHGVQERLGALDAVIAPFELWETLRIERGRPAFGLELDEDVLPPEAGIEDRAIDYRKGCYTGQEFIVRIRDRGKVNRHLRGALLGDATPPAFGTSLFLPDREAPVGETRSAVRSPRFGQTIVLAYVRREVEPPTHLRLGTREGQEAKLRTIDLNGWVLVEGDAALIA